MNSPDSLNKRLHLAKIQYESLLMNAGNIVTETKDFYISPLKESFTQSNNSQNSIDNNRDMKNSLLINTLQNEVERLKNKLNNVIIEAQSIVQDAENYQRRETSKREIIESQYVKKINDLNYENSLLKAEVLKLQKENEDERHNLKKALRFIDRIKSRSNAVSSYDLNSSIKG